MSILKIFIQNIESLVILAVSEYKGSLTEIQKRLGLFIDEKLIGTEMVGP